MFTTTPENDTTDRITEVETDDDTPEPPGDDTPGGLNVEAQTVDPITEVKAIVQGHDAKLDEHTQTLQTHSKILDGYGNREQSAPDDLPSPEPEPDAEQKSSDSVTSDPKRGPTIAGLVF
jgi:hypothetical protein